MKTRPRAPRHGDGNAASGNKADRQLIHPSAQIPWSVDVVSAVPKDLVDKLPEAVTGATCPGWACLGSKDGIFYVWQQRSTNLSESLLAAPKEYVKVYLADMVTNENVNHTPLVAIAPTPDGDCVHLFAANPSTGFLVLRKVSRKDVRSRMPLPLSYTTKVRIALGKEDIDSGEEKMPERLTTLTASLDGLVAVGTSSGGLFWVTQTSVPVGLHVQKVTLKKGYFSFLFSSSYDLAASAKSEIKCLLPMSITEFITVHKAGSAVHWKATESEAAHQTTFEPTSLGSIASSSDHATPLDFEDPTVLQASLSADQGSIHWIIRASPHQGSAAQLGGSQEPKLYWIETTVSKDDGHLSVTKSHWLSRFAIPETVEVLGLATADNGNAYAAFSPKEGGAVVVMVLINDDNIIQEVDMPATQVPGLLPNIFVKDVVTHGCTTIARSGIGIRVRYLPAQQLQEDPANKRRRLPDQSSNPSEVQKLVSHLRSTFWESYKNPDLMALHIPPSLKQAQQTDLEETVVTFCAELQYKADSTSSQNPLEWHKALIRLLQEGGLYRSLSVAGRWKIFSIGQELAVFFHLLQQGGKRRTAAWEQEQLSELLPHDICDWLLQIQENEVLGGWQNATPWSKLLCLCLEAAMAYRENCSHPLYDVMSTRPPQDEVRLWLSHPSLQAVLERQMNYWKQDPKGRADLKSVETVVKAALLSHSESCPDNGGRESSAAQYAKVKALAISLLRSINGGADTLAFELSIQHCYFEGLCQIAVDHEKKYDSNEYSLDPLFATLEGEDLKTGYTFAQFVLQWHTDAGLYGHAINYGRHSSKDLNLLMERDDRLRPYRWIPAIRQAYYTQATDSCLAVATDTYQDATLDSSLWALSLAKLATKMEATRNSSTVERQKHIERKLEQIHAQQMLLDTLNEGGIGAPQVDVPRTKLWTPKQLIDYSLDQLAFRTAKEDRLRLCLIGLAVCASIGDDAGKSLDQAARIWARSLELDSGVWTDWISTNQDLTDSKLRELALDRTVFGALVEECRKDASLKEVTYGRHIEAIVVDKLGSTMHKEEMTRLLRNVTTNESITATSLVVARY